MDFGDITGSTGFQIAYPLLNALLASRGQMGHNAAQGLNLGLGVANRFSEQAKTEAQNKALGQSLGSVLKSTTPVQSTQNVASMQVNPQTATYSMPEAVKAETAHADDQPLSPSVAAVPMNQQTITTQKPNFSPQAQSLGEALINAKRPDLILPTLAAQAFKQPETKVVGPGHVVLQDNQPVYTAPSAPVRQPTPPQPVVNQYGTMIPTRNAQGGYDWPSQPTPALTPPARALSDEERRLKEAQIGLTGARTGEARAQTGAAGALTTERNARTQRLKQLTDAVNDPKITKEKLTTIYSTAIRDREALLNAGDDPETVQRLADTNALVDDTRRRLAELGRGGGAAQPGAPAAAAAKPPGKAIGKTKDGKTVYQGPDGKRYVAN